MKIRSQLVLAFLLLSVVPLSAIVLYGYVASERAVRQAVEAEARSLTREMEGRMSGLRASLEQRFARLAELPLGELGSNAWSAEDVRVLGQVAGEIGDLAPLLDAVEFVPRPSPPPVADLLAPPSPPTPPVPQRSVVIRIGPLLEELRGLDEAARASAHVALAEAAIASQNARERAAVARQIERLAKDPALARELASVQAELARELGGKAPQVVVVHPVPPAPPAEPARPVTVPGELPVVTTGAELAPGERRERDAESARAAELLGCDLNAPVTRNGAVVGMVQARVKSADVLRQVLSFTRRDQGEVPFALDRQGELFTASDSDRKRLSNLPLGGLAQTTGSHPQLLADWTVVTSRDAASGVTFGIARPIGAELVGLRRSTLRTALVGSSLIGLALLGILPLSGRLTRGLSALSVAAERIAHGDLTTRVPQRGPREVAALAGAFNRMTEDLSRNQERLLEEERGRRAEELARRLLAVEVAQKTEELEEARAFQLSLLPKVLPQHPTVLLGVFMRTATEVGGDYYDFVPGADGSLTVAIGDATGHGAKAGTMVTVIKSLLSAAGERCRPAAFMTDASRAIKRMELGRMAMALSLVRVEPAASDAAVGADVRVTLAAAGMPPALIYRVASGAVEEESLPGMPLGGLVQVYEERSLVLAPGDTLLLATDGFPELLDPAGEPLGYVGMRQRFASAAKLAESPREVIIALASAAEQWAASRTPADDITFVALQARPA
jgi:serine phosphatase RsbU (regulator of sigma subunit)